MLMVLQLGSRLCIPSREVQRELLSKALSSPYSVHPWGTKMHKDLKQHFWWHKMKRKIALFIVHCLVCQKVKMECKRTAGMLQPLPIPEWKWENITMDFAVGLSKSPRGNNAI